MNAASRPERVVAIGASAGGVEALKELAAGLPADLPAPVLVVLHVPPSETSQLPAILQRSGPLPALHPSDGDRLEPGVIFVAPPDRHLMVVDGRARVVRGPKENLHRPAVDPLFRSAALTYGPDAIAVVLTGTLADGAAGAAAVADHGGTVVVQDPGEARYPDMPLSVIAADHPDHVLPLAQIAAMLSRLVSENRTEVAMEDAMGLSAENRYAAFAEDAIGRDEGVGNRSAFGCPECGGVLWEQDNGVLRFRCRVGHAYAAETLHDAQGGTLDTALWVALRALEERASLARRIQKRLRGRGNEAGAARHDQRIEEAEHHANVIRAVLAGQGEA
jgi:two-component system chemotaxis response regulator CheB